MPDNSISLPDDTTAPTEEPLRFLVALSFAGDNKREKVRQVAELLRSKLGDGKVFFDEFFEAELAGHDADTYLQEIYLNQTRLVVSCVCERYDEKPWTQDEWRAIRAFERDKCRTPEGRNRFLPLRFGDGQVAGIFSNAIVPDVRDRSAEEIAELILDKLEILRSSPTAVAKEIRVNGSDTVWIEETQASALIVEKVQAFLRVNWIYLLIFFGIAVVALPIVYPTIAYTSVNGTVYINEMPVRKGQISLKDSALSAEIDSVGNFQLTGIPRFTNQVVVDVLVELPIVTQEKDLSLVVQDPLIVRLTRLKTLNLKRDIVDIFLTFLASRSSKPFENFKIGDPIQFDFVLLKPPTFGAVAQVISEEIAGKTYTVEIQMTGAELNELHVGKRLEVQAKWNGASLIGSEEIHNEVRVRFADLKVQKVFEH
jgi:TIR domain